MLLALALADVARDDGRLMIHDSVDELARKTRQTRRGVQLQLRRMEDMGWLHTVSASDGGRGRATVYRIDERWINGGDMQAHPHVAEVLETANAATSNRERGSRFRPPDTANAATSNRERGSPSYKDQQDQIPPNPPLGGNAPDTRSPVKGKRRRPGEKLTLAAWLDRVRERGERAIPGDDPVFAYAEKIGLPRAFVQLAWLELKDRRMDGEKRQADWRAVLRNAVRSNWYRLWFIGADGVAELTTVGRQAQAAHSAAAQLEDRASAPISTPHPPTGPSPAPSAAGNSTPAEALVAGERLC